MFVIIYLPKFTREYKKLLKSIQNKVREAIFDLKNDPFTPHLKTHKLHGDLDDLYSCSVSYSYRMIFEIGHEKTIFLHSVGDHSIYDQL